MGPLVLLNFTRVLPLPYHRVCMTLFVSHYISGIALLFFLFFNGQNRSLFVLFEFLSSGITTHIPRRLAFYPRLTFSSTT
jgi:hypothetical protein